MKGRIKDYFEEKGFGFILGDDKLNYFFHISDVDTFEPLKRGNYVKFTPSANEKGYCAKEIKSYSNSKSSKKPSNSKSSKFIQLGDKNIRISDIKNYEIRHENSSVRAGNNFLSNTVNETMMRINNDINDTFNKMFGSNAINNSMFSGKSYLSVTTYQGDEYKFYENIDKYKAMLDKLLK